MPLPSLKTTLLLVCAAAALAGCGKAGSPHAPPGDAYPRHYPNPDSTAAHGALPPEWDQQDLDEAKPQGTPKQPKAIYVDPSVTSPQLARPALLGGPRGTTTVGGSPITQGLGGPGNVDTPLRSPDTGTSEDNQ